MDGTEGDMAVEGRRFANRLRELTGLSVLERDERLTSVEAEELVRAMDLPRRRKRDRGLRDMLAAMVLLRDFLEEN
jgi:putative transcription antitermination factor YqgF